MYSYAGRYMVSASVRRDGSSRFADGHRYGWFPSASAAWNIARENFFEDWKETMNNFKIRASYGVLGNQEIGNYRTQAGLVTGMNYIIGDKSWARCHYQCKLGISTEFDLGKIQNLGYWYGFRILQRQINFDCRLLCEAFRRYFAVYQHGW